MTPGWCVRQIGSSTSRRLYLFLMNINKSRAEITSKHNGSANTRGEFIAAREILKPSVFAGAERSESAVSKTASTKFLMEQRGF